MAAQAINIKLEDFEGARVRVPPVKSSLLTGRMMPHDVLKEAREEYQKIKKTRAVKAITYVIAKKPNLFKEKHVKYKGFLEQGRSEVSGGKARKDSLSQYSDMQFQSKGLRRPSMRSGRNDSVLGSNQPPTAKLRAQLTGIRSGEQSPDNSPAKQMYTNLATHTRNNTLREPYYTQKVTENNAPTFISSMLDNANASQKRLPSPGKVSFFVRQTKQQSPSPVPAPFKLQPFQVQTRTKSTLIRMVKVRQNLEQQADSLIQRFEDKLKKQEIRARKAREAKENAEFERQAYYYKRQQLENASRGRRQSQLLNNERKSLESYRSSISEVQSRQSQKRAKDQHLSQRDFQENNRTQKPLGYQRARSQSHDLSSDHIKNSLDSINTRIEKHQQNMRSHLMSLSQSMKEHGDFVQKVKADFERRYQESKEGHLLKTIQKHIKEDKAVKSTRMDQHYELDAYKERRALRFQRALENLSNLNSAKVDKNEQILKRQVDYSQYVDDMKSSRNHQMMVRQQMGRFQSAEVTQKLQTLRNEKLSQSKSILQRHQAIEEKRRLYRDQINQQSIHYQTQGQGGQGEQLEKSLSLKDRLLMDSECGKKSYLGPSRIPLNVGNPLLKDVSLYYSGAKKFRPKPTKSNPDVKGAVGNFIINQLLKF